MKKYSKIVISGVFFFFLLIIRSLRRVAGMRVHSSMRILYYHGVPSDKRAAFSRQLAILKRFAYVVPADWSGAVDPTRLTVAITFDDAFTSVIDNALPELSKHRFPCTIFVPTGFMGSAPNWVMETPSDRSEIVASRQQLADVHGPLVALGAHGETHLRMGRIEPEVALAEIRASRDSLAALTGAAVVSFAFPYGDYHAGVIEICQQEGFRHVFTISPQSVDPGEGSFVRGRVAVQPDDGAIEFFLKMAGAYQWMVLVSRLKATWRLSRTGGVQAGFAPLKQGTPRAAANLP